ncbi:MAG: valine--tRNA ligase [Candidatus Omnitrophica bacterium]|nr:valine--tRNA ligase [Candidatus Omnitrophota bacterium]
MELPSQYNPQTVEESRYQWWEAQGLFQADVDPTRKPYTIVIPPPNITGILHMGHALNNTIQDILIRWKRMQGFNALWVPGTDHAGIATQNVVERALAKEGKTRQDLGRDAFIQRVWQWKEQYGNTILYQLKRLGSSCDWRRTRFTMDEGLSEAVLDVFIRLYNDGLIYRGNYIINWCPRCQTALADEEAPRKDTQGKLYHIRYPIEGQGAGDGGQGKKKSHAPRLTPHAPDFIEVATTRPETMLGDTAIAVHPKDKRYKALIGKHAILPLVNRKISIIADEQVDKAFGTGAVKVTPAHDPVDFQLGKKHGLEFINVMTDDAHMTNVPKAYEGLDRLDCRSKLIVDLEQQGFLGAIDEHQHNVGHCYRCHTVVEPRLSPQWFVKMKPLAKPAIEAVKKGKLKFSPERWTKVYLNWMENIEDWCISRQIWWGHRLPVWYCNNCSQGQGAGDRGQGKIPTHAPRPAPHAPELGVIVSKSKPATCPQCGNVDLKQDEDVLDTWFSSWLWPFSTLGWPNKTKDLDYFYPTDTLVTAQEIIFFWVARMVMAGYFCMKDLPFSNVYIHGTVRDITGKKMSKSLGNIIDPLDIIKQYGTDALRYTLITSTAIGQDIFLSEERFTAGRNFANKLWNATRFVLAAGDAGGEAPAARPESRRDSRRARTDGGVSQAAGPAAITVPDRWILSRLQHTVMAVTKSLDACLFNEAATALYDFLWHDFCDWYLEIAKVQLQHQAPSTKQQETTKAILVHVLETGLRLLHPVMPFVTEELWQQLQHTAHSTQHTDKAVSIMKAAWPKPDKKLIDDEAESQFERFTAVVGAIRTTRAELNVPPDRKPPVHLITQHAALRSFFESQQSLLKTLAGVGEVHVAAKAQKPKDAASAVVDGIEVILPLAGLIDVDKERARKQQQVEELTKHLQQAEARLKDRHFTEKAPAEVVQGARDRKTQLEETLKKTAEHLAVLQAM